MTARSRSDAERAVRVTATGDLRDPIVEAVTPAGVHGWVRFDEDGLTRVHLEGAIDSVEMLVETLGDSLGAVEVAPVKVEGHEQFAVRGVPAGLFVIEEHHATAHHFDLRLEVDGVMRSWAVPKGPSLDPAVKRFAIQVPDHDIPDLRSGPGPNKIIWDAGDYEQGGRVPWPAAIERGHAVFVLRGSKLRGGFALQRTRGGDKPQWLLVKRRDEHAAPGTDVVAERPEAVDVTRP